MVDVVGGRVSKGLLDSPPPSRMAGRRALFVAVLAAAASMSAGCGSGGDLTSTVELPSQDGGGYHDGEPMPMASEADRLTGTPELTAAQLGYLSDLAAVGIHPANDLRALGVGAYVCQARAAGQSDQAVWDLVAPMVRSDVVDAPSAGPSGPAAAPDRDVAVDDVIRIATGRLC